MKINKFLHTSDPKGLVSNYFILRHIKPLESLPFIGLLLLILVACGAEANLNTPPEILYGQDPCDQCSMIINESRFATSYVTTSGDVRRFDDMGGMLVYDQQNHEDVHIYWVHDFNTEEWLNAANASIVYSPQLVTPMAWGLAAFTNQADAEQFANENGGTVTTFAALQQEIASGALDPASLENQIHTHEMEDTEGEHMDHDG